MNLLYEQFDDRAEYIELSNGTTDEEGGLFAAEIANVKVCGFCGRSNQIIVPWIKGDRDINKAELRVSGSRAMN